MFLIMNNSVPVHTKKEAVLFEKYHLAFCLALVDSFVLFCHVSKNFEDF